MSDLGPLFHWSPRERLKSIQRLGLMPGRLNVSPHYHWDEDGNETKQPYRQDSVSFSLDPATAWAYSHGAWRSEGTFDLWMVILSSEDEVHVNPMWGGRITEVRVHNRIMKRRLIWIGERTVAPKAVTGVTQATDKEDPHG
jgi:hypothetical protein